MEATRNSDQPNTPRHSHLLEWIYSRTTQLGLSELEHYFHFLKDNPKEAFLLIDSIERYSPSSISQLIQVSKNENFPIPVLIHQDQKVVFVNKATLELGGFSDPTDLVGRHILSFIPEEDHTFITDRMMHLIKTGVSSDPVPQKIRFLDGHTKTVILYGMLTTFQDKPAVQVFFQDIDQQEARTIDKGKQLALSESLNKALIQLVTNEKTEIVIPTVMGLIKSSFGADRVYIFENFSGPDKILFTAQKYELIEEGVTTQLQNPDLTFVPYHEMGFERWEEVLSRGECIFGNVEDLPEREQELLNSQQIQSLLVAPIIVDENFWGFIGLDACRWQRPWSKFERTTLSNLGLAIGGYMARMDALSHQKAASKILQKAQKMGNISSCTFLVEGGQWFFSESFRKTFGPIPDDPSMFHKAGRKVLSPEDYENLFRQWDSLLRSEYPNRTEGEVGFTRKGLSTRFFHYLLENEVSEEGKVTEINAIFQDITEEKFALENETNSRKKLERTQRIGKVGFWEFDFNTRKIWASDILYEMLDLSSQEGDAAMFLNQSVVQKDIDELVRKVKTAITEDKAFDIIQRLQLKTGRSYFFEIYGEMTKDQNGIPTKLSGTSKDITEKKDTEQRFKVVNINFASILESTEDLIFSVDKDFCIIAYNSSFSQLIHEWTDQTITTGTNLLKILSSSSRIHDIDRQIATLRLAMTGEPVVDHLKITPDSSGFIYYEITMNPIWGDDHVVQGVSVFGKDVSLQIEKEKEIKSLNSTLEKKVAIRTRELEKTNKELETFAYSISHDLRTPLRHLNGYSSLLRSKGQKNLEEETLEYLEFIESSSRKMNSLIEDLLEYSRLGRRQLNKQPISLMLILSGLTGYFRHQSPEIDIEFTLDIEQEVFGDHILIETVITNLLSNSIKYRKPGMKAQIEIRTELTPEGVNLIVIDQGIGFDMKYIEQVFGIFKRLHSDDEYEGSGIGLANVARIMHRHSGTIEADAKENEGATFTCFFPDAAFL